MTPDADGRPVPVLDLGRAARRIEPELDAAWRRLREETAFVGGGEVERFDRAFASFLGVPGVVGVANDTDAIEIALRALDLEPGAEVVVPAFTFIATASAVLLAGGRPVFADVEPGTLNLDPDDAFARVTDRTAGILGVHLYGCPYDVDRVAAFCCDRSLWMVEDAAQAHGARWRGRRVGGFGALATWSFYPSKNLGTFGDGGALSGPIEEHLERSRLIANHGRVAHYRHAEVGRNSRLDALQAAVLDLRLAHLDEDNARRREIAAGYSERLAGVGDLRLPEVPEEAEPVWHQYTVRTGRRDALQAFLAERGVGSGIHYPLPLHQQPAFAGIAGDVELPVSEAAAREVLCLPIFAELTDGEAERVTDAVLAFFDG